MEVVAQARFDDNPSGDGQIEASALGMTQRFMISNDGSASATVANDANGSSETITLTGSGFDVGDLFDRWTTGEIAVRLVRYKSIGFGAEENEPGTTSLNRFQIPGVFQSVHIYDANNMDANGTLESKVFNAATRAVVPGIVATFTKQAGAGANGGYKVTFPPAGVPAGNYDVKVWLKEDTDVPPLWIYIKK